MDLLIAPNTVPMAQADTAPLSGTPQWATNGNPATNTPATVLPAYAFNALQAELTNAIQAAGITLDRTKLTQLAAAIQAMTQGAKGNTALDTGTANAYAGTLTPPITAYTPGMLVSLQSIKASNTGASTLALNGLAALPIQGPGGTALQGGELVSGFGALLRVNAAATAFELIQTTGGSLPVKAATASRQAVNLGQLVQFFYANNNASGTSVSVTLSFTPTQNGYLWVDGSASVQSSTWNPTAVLSATGATTVSSGSPLGTGGNFVRQINVFTVTAGTPVSITYSGTTAASAPLYASISAFMLPKV